MSQNQSLEHHERKRTAVFDYDFARDGGGLTGDTAIPGDAIPDDAIIVGGICEVTKDVTAAGLATVAAKINGAADLMAATAKASMTAGDFVALVPDEKSVATLIKTNGAKTTIDITVATGPLTGGAMTFFIDYFMGS